MPPSPQITLLSQLNRSTKTHYRLIPVSPLEQFRHNIYNLIRTTLMSNDFDFTKPRSVPAPPGLKKIAPYWYPYTTMTKMRWIGRELLEVVSTEFRDRSMEYYVRSFIASSNGASVIDGLVEICSGIGCDDCERPGGFTYYDIERWRPNRVRRLSISFSHT
jgi:tRNA pseudouridine synthase 9